MDREELDNGWMQKAVAYGLEWEGLPHPNPGVVALLAQKDRLLSLAQHRVYGGAHAEVLALRKAPGNLRGATLYLTLEPCSHYGKTPPCTEAILRSGIRRVVVGCKDPNPKVNGEGIAALKREGVEVRLGTQKRACERLHRAYLFAQTARKPYVSLKWAMTLDGKLADSKKKSRYLTGKESLKLAHRLRANHSAVLVGIETVLRDDPLLLPWRVKAAPGHQKKITTRVVLDTWGRLPLESQLARSAQESPLYLFCHDLSKRRARALKERGISVFLVPRTKRGLSLPAVLKTLYQEQRISLLVEGGSQVLGSFLDRKLFQEVHIFLAGKLLGGEQSLSPTSGRGFPLSAALPLNIQEVRESPPDCYLRATI